MIDAVLNVEHYTLVNNYSSLSDSLHHRRVSLERKGGIGVIRS